IATTCPTPRGRSPSSTGRPGARSPRCRCPRSTCAPAVTMRPRPAPSASTAAPRRSSTSTPADAADCAPSSAPGAARRADAGPPGPPRPDRHAHDPPAPGVAGTAQAVSARRERLWWPRRAPVASGASGARHIIRPACAPGTGPTLIGGRERSPVTIRRPLDARAPGRGPAPSPALLIAVLSITGITAALMQTIIIPLVPTLPEILDTSVTDAAWPVTAALLAGAVTTP